MAPVNRLLVTITCMSLSGLITDLLQVHTLVGIVAFGRDHEAKIEVREVGFY